MCGSGRPPTRGVTSASVMGWPQFGQRGVVPGCGDFALAGDRWKLVKDRRREHFALGIDDYARRRLNPDQMVAYILHAWIFFAATMIACAHARR